MATKIKPSAGAMRAATKALLYAGARVSTELELLANMIAQETGAAEMADALEKLIAADNCNYTVETMRYEELFHNAQLALAKYRGE